MLGFSIPFNGCPVVIHMTFFFFKWRTSIIYCWKDSTLLFFGLIRFSMYRFKSSPLIILKTFFIFSFSQLWILGFTFFYLSILKKNKIHKKTNTFLLKSRNNSYTVLKFVFIMQTRTIQNRLRDDKIRRTIKIIIQEKNQVCSYSSERRV